MATIVTRAGKGSALTNAELDANFNNLNAEKIERDGSIQMTGRFLLVAGTTSLAPMAFAAGVLLTTPVAHNIEWDGSFMYLTNSGATRRTVAFLDAPAFTGAPTSTTAAVDTNTTQIATTAFVVGQASAVTPAVLGAAAIGTSLRYARADHAHSATILSNVFRVADNTDATKLFALNVSGFTTATTRTWIVPNSDDTFVGVAATQTLSNKTLATPTITGPVNEAQGANIASAATINLDTATGNTVDVTGTTTITGVTLSQGRRRTVRFTGVLTLTNGANLVLPTGANITTAVGDYATFIGYASGVVRCESYERASGAALVGSGGGTPDFLLLERNIF